MSREKKTKKYFGICLSGGKNEKTFFARIDEFDKENKLILTSILNAPQGDYNTSNDKLLLQHFSKIKNIAAVGVDVPTDLPKCVTCKLKCPGVERCKVESVKYMWDLHRKKEKNKPVFTPYTERAVEHYINAIEKDVFLSAALGANSAPLTARAKFLQKHFKATFKEVFPKLTYLRLSRHFGLPREFFNTKRHSEDGDEARWQFLKLLTNTDMIFMYNQDVQLMVDNPYAFDAFMVALTLILDSRKLCEPRPKGFPKADSWILFPKEQIEI
ncbi:MAG: DUF429 domain-containing protein [Bdellovibrionales bacterium]|nr:DUF429 domain-containing protein [Bdellovibrionales bacterium]